MGFFIASQQLGRCMQKFIKSKEYAHRESVNYTRVDVPNARWHETHTFTCFAFPTYSESDMEQIAAAILKVIKAFEK